MKFLNWIVNAILLAVAIIAFYGVAPGLESKFMAVYSRFEPVMVEEMDETHIKVQFRYTKWRECPPLSFTWYNGNIGTTFRQINVLQEDPEYSASRPLGNQLSSVFIMNVSLEQFNNTVFAEIYNRCHGLWPTRTVIFP